MGRATKRVWVSVVVSLVLLGTLLVSATHFSASGTPATTPTVPGGVATADPPSSDWPTYLGEVSRDSANLGETTLSSANAPNLSLLWNYSIGAANPGYLQAEPVEANHTVYVGGGNGYFYALNSSTGALVWKSPNLGTDSTCTSGGSFPNGITSSATVSGGVVYVGGGAGTFYALHQATGTIDWSYSIGSVTQGYYIWGSPLVLPNLGYAYIGVSSNCDHPLVDGGLLQLSLTSHSLVHFFSDLNSTEEANCLANPLVDCGGSIWGSPSYDAATNSIWAATGNGYNNSLNDTVPQYGDSLLEWNATTLSLLGQWKLVQNKSDMDFGTTPTLVNPPNGPPMVFVTNKNGWSYAFDRATFTQGPAWQYFISYGPDNVAPDAYGGGQIYIGGHGTALSGTKYLGSIRAFNPLVNKTLWAVGLPGEVYGAPVYANGLVVVASGNLSVNTTSLLNTSGGELAVLNSTTGKLLFSYTANPFLAAPSIAYGTIFVENTNGQVLAFSPRGPPPVYPVTFSETGLPSGTAWWVNLTNGQSFSSTSPTITFSEQNGTYTYALASANKSYSAPGGTFAVKGSAVPKSVTFSPVTYSIAFTESGLPSGTEWWVNLTSEQTFTSTSPTITFSEQNGTYTYALASANKSYSASGGTFAISGTGVSRSVTFSPVTYSVTFTETGLPSGTEWWANVSGGYTNSSTGSTIGYSLANGTYVFEIATSDKTYSSAGGTVAVDGTDVSLPVTFARVTYSVAFTESGLPAGMTWWLNISGQPSQSSTSTGISLPLPNGTYSYSVSAGNAAYASPGGQFSVSGGPVSRSVAFSSITYGVTFTETGLPTGDRWFVNVTEGPSLSALAPTTSLSVNVTNGTYTFVAATNDPGYAPSYRSGFVVAGAPVSVPVTFSQRTYSILFAETGLRAGTDWSVTVNGTVHHTTGTSITFIEPSGTYSFGVAAVPGYTATPPSGTIDLGRGNATESVVFHPTAGSSGGAPTFLGLPGMDGYLLIGGVFVAAAAVGAAWGVVSSRRRRGSSSVPPPEETAPPVEPK